MTANSVHYLMEVRPLSGAEPFRCECEPPSLMLSFKSPPFGAPVKMECVPSKKKARFDRNDPAISKQDAGKQQRGGIPGSAARRHFGPGKAPPGFQLKFRPAAGGASLRSSRCRSAGRGMAGQRVLSGDGPS